MLDFRGGESAALARLDYYLFQSNLIASYFDTRNGMLGGCAASQWGDGRRVVLPGWRGASSEPEGL